MLARLFGKMRRVQMMAVRHVGVMTGLFVIPRGVVFRRCPVMLRRVLVMLSGLHMVLFACFRHGVTSFPGSFELRPRLRRSCEPFIARA